MPFLRLSFCGIVLAGLLFSASSYAASPKCVPWPDWDNFRSRFLSGDGRVIDHGSMSDITTSEGQAYSMFFALVANDRTRFDLILKWTINNLAKGNLTDTLPAWQWGKRPDGSWAVMDDNAAADADLWMAYTLTEAGRLWKDSSYTKVGKVLAHRILDEETATIDKLGRTLLPGPRSFHLPDDVYRLNPSYYPIQLMRRLAAAYPDTQWDQVVTTSINALLQSSEKGYAPDWVLFKNKVGFMPDKEKKAAGSYDAIRVYLWAGMLAENDPARAVLIKKFNPMIEHVLKTGIPPLEVNTQDAATSGYGPIGFSSAILPFIAASNQKNLLEQQRLRVVNAQPFERWDNYYEQVLTLFGTGWLEKRFKFDKDGKLVTNWNCHQD
jgi:endo-1,4-beta-D-glucanase Y